MLEKLSLCAAAGALLLACVTGYIVGRIVDVQRSFANVPMYLVPDTRPTVPVIRLHGVRNGGVEGQIIGDARLFLGEEHVTPSASGAFRASADLFLTNTIDITIPDGMAFVASSRGKKYYPVQSAAGEKIVPKNRIYFRTAEEAAHRGYVP